MKISTPYNEPLAATIVLSLETKSIYVLKKCFEHPAFLDHLPFREKYFPILIQYLDEITNKYKSNHLFWGEYTRMDIFIYCALVAGDNFKNIPYSPSGHLIDFHQVSSQNNLINLQDVAYRTANLITINLNPWLYKCQQLLTPTNVNQVTAGSHPYLIRALHARNLELAILCILSGADIFVKDPHDKNVLELVLYQKLGTDTILFRVFLGLLFERGWYIFQHYQYEFCDWEEKLTPKKFCIRKQNNFLEYKVFDPNDQLQQDKIPLSSLKNYDPRSRFAPNLIAPKILAFTALKSHTRPFMHLTIKNYRVPASVSSEDTRGAMKMNLSMLHDYDPQWENPDFAKYWNPVQTKELTARKFKKAIRDAKKTMHADPESEKCISFSIRHQLQLEVQSPEYLAQAMNYINIPLGSTKMTVFMQAAFLSCYSTFKYFLLNSSEINLGLRNAYAEDVYALLLRGRQDYRFFSKYRMIKNCFQSFNLRQELKNISVKKQSLFEKEYIFKNTVNNLFSAIFSTLMIIKEIHETTKRCRKWLKKPENLKHSGYEMKDWQALDESSHVDEKLLLTMKEQLEDFQLEILHFKNEFKKESSNIEGNLLIIAKKIEQIKQKVSVLRKYEDREVLLQKAHNLFEREELRKKQSTSEIKAPPPPKLKVQKPKKKLRNKKKITKEPLPKPSIKLEEKSAPSVPMEVKVPDSISSFLLEKKPRSVNLGDYLSNTHLEMLRKEFKEILEAEIDEKQLEQKALKRDAILGICAEFSNLANQYVLQRLVDQDSKMQTFSDESYYSYYISRCLKHIRHVIYHNFYQLITAKDDSVAYQKVVTMGEKWEKMLFFPFTIPLDSWAELQENPLFKQLAKTAVIDSEHYLPGIVQPAQAYLRAHIERKDVPSSLKLLHNRASHLSKSCLAFYPCTGQERADGNKLRHSLLLSFMSSSSPTIGSPPVKIPSNRG